MHAQFNAHRLSGTKPAYDLSVTYTSWGAARPTTSRLAVARLSHLNEWVLTWDGHFAEVGDDNDIASLESYYDQMSNGVDRSNLRGLLAIVRRVYYKRYEDAVALMRSESGDHAIEQSNDAWASQQTAIDERHDM